MSGTTALLAIPAHDEESTIDRVLESVLPYGLPVLVVDDGSRDRTAERARRHPVAVTGHPANLGYGHAMRTIFRQATERGHRWVITMDCDEQHSPGSIGDFLEAISGDRCDVVSGSRYLRPDSAGDEAPGRRREVNLRMTEEINRALGAYLSADRSRPALGAGITDAFCGFKAYRVDALRYLSLDVDGYDFPLQFWVQAVAHGLRVDEIPVPRIYLDPNRSFGADLDDADRRLALYRSTFERELGRCRDAIRPPDGIRA